MNIRELYDNYVSKNGEQPLFVDVAIVWKDSEDEDFYTIALFEYEDDSDSEDSFDDDEQIFFYCSGGIDELEKLEKVGNSDFSVVADERTLFY